MEQKQRDTVTGWIRENHKGLPEDIINTIITFYLLSEVDVIFDRFDPNDIEITNNGKSIKRIRFNKDNQCVYSSTKLSQGIQQFTMKIDGMWHKHSAIGIVSKIYEGLECKGKWIDTDKGWASISNLKTNDVIKMILNFDTMKMRCMVNGILREECELESDTYYPCVRFCYQSSLNHSCCVLN